MCLEYSKDIFGENPVICVALVGVLGICVGSFLNVLALRSLREESLLWPPSNCPKCKHRLSLLDNIPLLSYLCLRGKCRYCQEKISMQYPLVEFFTGIIFALIAFQFLVKEIPYDDCGGAITQVFLAIQNGLVTHNGNLSVPETNPLYAQRMFIKIGLALSCFFLASTLIAITITDIREKLIPHDITYPSMLIGIIFSTIVMRQPLEALAGIGASYIIFDFLAFYGLKIYLMGHKRDDIANSSLNLEANSSLNLDKCSQGNSEQSVDDTTEPIEVMGGGDAVLAAVMSAYLGWPYLVLILCVGFLSGTLFGLLFLVREMVNASLINIALRRSLIWGGIGAILSGAFSWGMTSVISTGMNVNLETGLQSLVPLLGMFFLGGICGGLLGFVTVGTKVSKPFPFGPALALGGFLAMFMIPHWLPFH